MSDVKMQQTCPYCPVQFEGTVNGHPAYFRARWSSWSFSIAKVGKSPVLVKEEDALYFRTEEYGGGGFGAAGAMPPEEAMDFIKMCAEEFEKGSRGDLDRPKELEEKYEKRDELSMRHLQELKAKYPPPVVEGEESK